MRACCLSSTVVLELAGWNDWCGLQFGESLLDVVEGFLVGFVVLLQSDEVCCMLTFGVGNCSWQVDLLLHSFCKRCLYLPNSR